MSTLLAEAGCADLGHDEFRPGEPPARETLVDPRAPRLHQQVLAFLSARGLSKMDMLLFIAIYTLIVLLVAALCLSARFNHAQAFQWGARLMNLPLAAGGIGLLLLVVAGAALALRSAGRCNRRATGVALGIATLGCLGFAATSFIDFQTKWRYGVRPGDLFNPNERYVARRFGVKLPKRPADDAVVLPVAAPPARVVSATNGRRLFLGTCLSCHGPRGEGMPGQGKSLQTSEFVAGLDDAKLADFLRVGRQPWDPANTTKIQMPPRGGNPMLGDDDLRDIVAFVRTLQSAAPAAKSQPGGAATATGAAGDAQAAGVAAAQPEEPVDPSLLLQRWVVSPPPPDPAGLSAEFLADSRRARWQPPRDAAAFANAYCIATQFTALHAIGVGVIFAVLAIQAWRGRITPDRRAPLALGFAGSVALTALWLAIFPLVYLR